MLGITFIVAGLALIGLHFFCFRVEPNTVALTKGNPKGFDSGWKIGFLPSSTKFISLKRHELCIPIPGQDLIALRTPDGGEIGVALVLIWSHDHTHANALQIMQTVDETNSVLRNRVLSALNYWIHGKPFPGTAKRALTGLAEAERAIREKLTGVSTQTLSNRNEEYLGPGYANTVNDLAVQIHEINITEMVLLEKGSDKPDWGDGEHIGFDAQAIFKQFHAHTDNLSTLRKLKEALLEKYAEEADDIEDIYDQVRISMKETRER